MIALKVGQKRISKNEFPDVGKYIIEIVSLGEQITMINFTATGWEDHHWVNNVPTSNEILLEDYLVLDE